MSFDGMRVGGGRCPPLLVGGLVLACFLLAYNWWGLSTENNELLHQIDDLSQQLKISAEERDQCVTLRGKVEQRYKILEDEVGTLHVKLDQEKELQKRKEETVTICKSELDSLKRLDSSKSATLETLRLEKETINGQLEERKEENKRLQEDLEKTRDELNRFKITADSQNNDKKNDNLGSKKVTSQRSTKQIRSPHLVLVPENAVEISQSGLRGIKYHGVPILPRDPPGAVRLPPQLSITNLKADDSTALNNDTQNGGNQDEQNVVDAAAGNEHFDDKDNAPENMDNLEEDEQPEDNARERAMKSTMEFDEKENGL